MTHAGEVLSRWRKDVLNRRCGPTDGDIKVVAPLARSEVGGSGTFLAVCSDDARRWVKPPNNPQGGKVIVTELVVARAGSLIGAPVCEVVVVHVPGELAGWEFRPGERLAAGLAPGSRAVEDAIEIATLAHRDRDDNARRHSGVFALYDWCWGADDQWLYQASDDHRLFSHDHGWYLPEPGAEWSVESLNARVDQPHAAQHPHVGLDREELRRLAGRLRNVSHAELVGLLRTVPADWPVSDDELAHLGRFLECRAPAVAQRLELMAAALP
jgi:hypothetical protein